jgi:hypothetical protein
MPVLPASALLQAALETLPGSGCPVAEVAAAALGAVVEPAAVVVVVVGGSSDAVQAGTIFRLTPATNLDLAMCRSPAPQSCDLAPGRSDRRLGILPQGLPSGSASIWVPDGGGTTERERQKMRAAL